MYNESGGLIMRITFEEFEQNVDYFLEKSADEDIYIIKDGVPISVLLSPEEGARLKEFKEQLKTR